MLGQPMLKIRYITVGHQLGAGQFATVYKAIDVDSRKLMAVKIIERLMNISKKEYEK